MRNDSNNNSRPFLGYELRGSDAVELAFQPQHIAAAIPINPADRVCVGDSDAEYESYELWFKDDPQAMIALLDLEKLHGAAPWMLRLEIDDEVDGVVLGAMLLSPGTRTWQKNTRSSKTSSLVRLNLPRKRKTLPVLGTVSDHYPHEPDVIRRAHSVKRRRPVIETHSIG